MRSRPHRLAALALLLAPSLAAAHDFWLQPDGAGLVLRHGHRGGALLLIDRPKVKAIRCLDGGATRDLLGAATFAPREVRLAGRCGAASVAYDDGSWALTPDGEVNRPRAEVPQAVKGWASRQFAKWIEVRSPAAVGAVFGDELELVAAGDLSRARAGDTVTLRALSGGKPVAGARLDVDDRPLGESDARGEVRVRLRAAGVQTISATLRGAGATPGADATVLEASLSFEVAR